MAKKKNAGAKYFGKPLTDDPDDAPELLNDFFRHGELRHSGKLIRRGRPPLSGKPKTAITLRLDEDVVEAYRETGEGWQTQINADLRRARKLTVRTATSPRSGKSIAVAVRSKANQTKARN
jgi:BrnA antitoxin of type II toxin-antitoxin system